MSYQFRSLSDVELVNETTDSTNVLIEENGKIKKVSKTEVGGKGIIPTVILQNPNFMEYISNVMNPSPMSLDKEEGQTESSEQNENDGVQAMEMSYPECINMNFDEVWEMAVNGQPFNIILQDVYDYYPYTFPCYFRISGERRLTVYNCCHDDYGYYIWDDEGFWIES